MILAPLCNIKYNRHTLGVYRNKNPNAIHEDRWYGLWAESSSREKALKNFNQGADPVCWSSGAIPRKSITGIVPPLLMIHLLFWRSSWAINT
jgi:hypothetical protein